MTAGGILSDADAAERLATAWTQMHTQEVDAWEVQAQADVAEQEEQRRLADADEERLRAEDERQKEDERKELEKKRPKINDFDDDKMDPTGRCIRHHAGRRPSRFEAGHRL